MTTSILLAGATGVVGRQLVPLLVAAGYRVFGTTRRSERARALEAAGAEPVLLDALDAASVNAELARIRPAVLIHQLTDLPRDLDPARMPAASARNALLRRDGTAHLMRAARQAGTRRAVAQSIAWLYDAGTAPHREDDPLGVAPGASRVTLDGVLALERAVLGTPPVEGVVLRYGQFYGPGTIDAEPPGHCAVHVEAAARAALLAVERGRPGVYNVVDDSPWVSNGKARRELGWDPAVPRAP